MRRLIKATNFLTCSLKRFSDMIWKIYSDYNSNKNNDKNSNNNNK